MQVNVVGKLGQDALAAVSAVAADEDVIVGKPVETKVISSTASSGRVRWLGSALGLAVLVLAFLPLVSPWRLRYSRMETGKAKTLVGAQNG